MKVAVVYNRDLSGVINVAKVQNKETYDPATVEAVAASLERGGHNVRLLDGNMHVIEQLREFMPRVVAGDRPGMVFNMAYGIQGVSRYTHLPALLEMLGVPYVGSNPQAHAVALDKVIAKVLFQSQGISTPRFWNFATPDDEHPDITFPVIVKPKMEGMSLGITLVHNRQELRVAVSRIIRQFKQHVLVEEFIAGREFTVGLLGNADVEVLPVVELDLEGDAKKIRVDEGRRPLRKVCPAPLSKAQTARLQDLARRTFLALGLHDYGRIDVRMDEAGTPYVLEINSMADLGRDGAYVFSAKHAGYDFDALINRVLNVAAARYFGVAPSLEPATSARPTRATVGHALSAAVRSHVRSQATTIDDSLQGLADLQSPREILERVESQLALVGVHRRAKKRGAVGEYAYFSNYTGKQPGLILMADLDAPDARSLRVSEDGNRVYGHAHDIGGVVVALSALRALRFARALRSIRCGFLLAWGDDAEPGGRHPYTEAVSQARAILGMGAADVDGAFILSRAGEGRYRLSGRPAAGSARSRSADAIIKDFIGRLSALQQIGSPETGVEVSVTRIDVEGQPGAIPQRLDAAFTLRFRTPRQGHAADTRIRKVAARRAATGVAYDVAGGLRLVPFAASRANRTLLRTIDALAKETHGSLAPARHAEPSRLGAFANGRPCLDGFGPFADSSSAGEPFVLRRSLQDRAVLLALTLHRLSAAGR